MKEISSPQRNRLDPVDETVVQRGLRALGWDEPGSGVSKLAGSRSGSQVFLVESGGEHLVLKATEDPAWHARAIRELHVYDAFGSVLGDFLPQVRAVQHDERSVRLLLTGYAPCPAAASLSDGAWAEVAHRLGQLQRAADARPPWLTPRPWPSDDEVSAALALWAGHGLAGIGPRATALLAAAREVDGGLPAVLTHGDCHLGNLLQSATGQTLWADWQEAGLGPGLDDLVFLWQRAEFDGAHPPRAAMTSAYAAGRAVLSDDDVRAAVAAAELRLLLVAWPPFLRYGSAQRRRLMAQRLLQLLEGAD